MAPTLCFPFFFGGINLEKRDHLSIPILRSVDSGVFCLAWYDVGVPQKKNTHTSRNAFHGTDLYHWGKSVGDSHLSANGRRTLRRDRPQVRAKLMGAFAGTKMGDWQGGDLPSPSPHNPMGSVEKFPKKMKENSYT